jgi:hypothetical protein
LKINRNHKRDVERHEYSPRLIYRKKKGGGDKRATPAPD